MSHYNGLHLTWPETPIGQTTLADELCITVEGRALERKCLGDFYTGAYWSPVEKDCADVQSELTVTLHKLAKRNITEDNILNTTLNMEMLTTTSEDLSTTDVQYVAQILRNAASVPAVEPAVLRSVVHTVDTTTAVISTAGNREILSNTPTKINTDVENIALNAQTEDQVFMVAGSNFAVSVLPFASFPRGGVLESWGFNMTVLLNDSDRDPHEWLNHFESFEAAVLLPESVLRGKRKNKRTNMVIVVHRNSQFLQNVKVISPVIDVVMGSKPVYDVDPPLEMVFKVSETSLREKKAKWGCVSWDETLNNSFGGWSYKGCFSVLVDSTHVRCYCNHLTSFAVILEISPGLRIPKVHTGVLSIITYIGCSLSIFGLGFVILTFAIFRNWRKDMRHKILFNLSLSLVSFLLIFLVGIKKTGWGFGCMVVAVLLHYFMLASFSWMLVEAFLQYLCLVKVLGTYIPCMLQKAMLFAWGTYWVENCAFY
ncbi:Adhesion G-protein coupled receptor G6 [Araneus ventricosus]|uniref:Adhesion G-protein coupled receptor G6 n=1 Tax=Araneus ventricosus TaxID=182803 RepID=A0A4Y2TRZ8_ARAVE|nr:Adhesion G-protein coupled receptor G6 [Araneus ventricosus]